MKQSLSFLNDQQLNRPIISADLLGAFASGLCMVHCIATPFLFIAQSCSAACCEASPNWWSWLDYAFLMISFLAVWQTNKTASKDWVKYGLWISWLLLLAAILNKKLSLILIPEIAVYLPALSLIVFHFYNLKYCQFKTEGCCIR